MRLLVQHALLVNDIALFVEGKNPFIRYVDEDLVVIGQVHFTLDVCAHLAEEVNDGSAWQGLDSEKVKLVSLPYLKVHQSARDDLSMQQP